MNLKSSYPGVWISIDGSEGMGKTLLARHLQATFHGVVIAPEFSDTPVGQFLRNSVVRRPHIISESLIEQSLLFLADFFRTFDVFIRSHKHAGNIVVSDRGYASKYIYQYRVLASAYDPKAARQLLDALFELMPPPDFTLLLQCDEATQIRRLLARDGHCDAARLAFIRNAQLEYVPFLSSRGHQFVEITQGQDTSKDEFLRQGELIVRDFLRQVRGSIS